MDISCRRQRPQQANFLRRMGGTGDADIMDQQMSSSSLIDQMDSVEDMREKTTSLPLLDQHVSLVKEHSSWWLPAAGGILAVGLSFSDPILEYIDLNTGLLRNVLESVSGKRIRHLLIRAQ